MFTQLNFGKLITHDEYLGLLIFKEDLAGIREWCFTHCLPKARINSLYLTLPSNTPSQSKTVSPLIDAVYTKNYEILELLIQEGCRVDGFESDQFSPLHAALEILDLDMANKLLECGADPNALDWLGRPPIFSLTCKPSSEWGDFHTFLKKYVTRGFNATRTTEDGANYLHIAAKTDLNLIGLFRTLCPELMYLPDSAGRLPIHCLASQEGSWASIDDLLDPQTINARCEKGWTPAHYAAWAGRKMTMRKLKNFGAKFELIDAQGRTPTDLLRYF